MPAGPALTNTETVSLLIGIGELSYIYCNLSPATNSRLYITKCSAVEKVWVQATSLLKPMLTNPGIPANEPPITSICPGIVKCDCQKRKLPVCGKCGLPNTMPLPFSVLSFPKPQPLEPKFRGLVSGVVMVAERAINLLFISCTNAVCAVDGAGPTIRGKYS